MVFDPLKHHRRSTRLKDFDYSSCGAYAVTLCTQNRICYFTDPMYYHAVEKAWERIPKHFPMVIPDSIGIVPDHIHMILCFESSEGKRPVLGTVVGRFKSDISRAISRYAGSQAEVTPKSIWQVKFHDHIIRDERELERERRYVLENPEKHQLRERGERENAEVDH